MKYSMLMYAVVLGCAVHVNAAAQGSTYRRQAGDTLLYREVTEERVQVQGEPQEYHRFRDALVAVAFTGGDTMRAWYEDLQLSDDELSPGRQTAGPEAVGLGFLITLDERGRGELLGSNDFPGTIVEIWDPQEQFNGFFPVLPERALQPGLEWGDTLLNQPFSGRTQGVESYSAVHRVVGDSMIHEIPVVIVESRVESNANVREGPDDKTPMVGTSHSTERGRFYFSTRDGLLVRRTITGEIDMILTYFPPEGSWKDQTVTAFTTTIELVAIGSTPLR
jgi:hypothetical protein